MQAGVLVVRSFKQANNRSIICGPVTILVSLGVRRISLFPPKLPVHPIILRFPGQLSQFASRLLSQEPIVLI